MVENFYKKIIENLKTNRTFLKENNKIYKYSDILKFYNNLNDHLKKISHKKLRICTLSKKTFRFYSSIISILISKNTWVPLDENLPDNIMKYMIKSSKADVVLVDTLCEKKFSQVLKNNKIVTINIDKIKLSKKKNNNKFNHFKSNDISMIFFTSGSTGLPKGVKISNTNYISSLYGQIKNIYSNVKNCKDLNFADYHQNSFVISLNIILPCIYFASRITPMTNDFEKLYFLDHIKKNNVSCLITLPSTIDQIKLSVKKKFDYRLKIMILCGEPFYYDVLDFLLKKIKPQYLFNAYGSTELSPWVYSYKFNKKELNEIKKVGMIPIGQNFFNVKKKIINQNLLVSGPMVNNYLDKKFNSQNHKVINNKVWYQTNDKIKKIKKNIYVIGRSDSIVKVKGYRIELRGIESVIRAFEKVNNCFVFLSHNRKKIIAAVESEDKNIEKSLFLFLKKNLQSYMRPNIFFYYSSFPKNKNGKIDRQKIKLISYKKFST